MRCICRHIEASPQLQKMDISEEQRPINRIPLKVLIGLAGTLTSDHLHFFDTQGYLLIESFSSNEEVEGLRKRMDELLLGFDPSSSASVFSTKNQVRRDRREVPNQAGSWKQPSSHNAKQAKHDWRHKDNSRTF